MNLAGNFNWWVGVVEDRNDPEKLGRCRVRIFGHHTHDVEILPTSKLPWAVPLQPIISAGTSGVGFAPVGPVEGTWVVGWFLDDDDCQQPMMMGTIGGKNEKNPLSEKKQNQANAIAGNFLQSSSGALIKDGAGNPISTGATNSTREYTTETSSLYNENNPSGDPTKALNDGSLATKKGFTDPNKVYPKLDYSDKPDTNKLATGDKSHKYFNVKNKNRKTSIAQAVSGTWDEPKTPYSANYPYNQVIETEAGHVIELDSTPNRERVHIYHKKGSFIEIDVNGSVIKKTVGDSYEINDRNGYVYVKGAHSLTVGGPTKILVQNNADIEVDGDTTITSHRSTLVQSATTVQVVAEDVKVSGKSSLQMISDGAVNIQGSSITLNAKSGSLAGKASDKIAFDAGQTASISGGLELLLDAAVIKSKMGAISIRSTKLPVPKPPETKTVDGTTLNPLKTPDSESIFLGDSLCKNDSAIAQERIKIGDVSTDLTELTDTSKTTAEKDTSLGTTRSFKAVTPSEFGAYTDIPDSLKISKYFTLADLSTKTAASSYAIRDQAGLTKEEISTNLKHLAVNVLDKVKDQYPDMVITSGFRTKNESSDHDKGQAVDLQFSSASSSDYYNIAKWIRDNTPYRQVLLEYARRSDGSLTTWIHVAASRDGARAPMPIGTLVNHSVNSPGARNAFVNLG